MDDVRTACKRGQGLYVRAKTTAKGIVFNEQGYIVNPDKYWESEDLYDKAMECFVSILDIVGDSELRRLANLENQPFDPEKFKTNMGYSQYASSRRACQHIKTYMCSTYSQLLGDLCGTAPIPKDCMDRLERARLQRSKA